MIIVRKQIPEEAVRMRDSYRRYQEARDTAWRALLCVREKRLPIDAEQLARDAGMQIEVFPDAREEPKLYALICRAGGSGCVSLRIQGVWHIFLRPMGEANRRFAIAHELGHLTLRHETRILSPGVRAFRSAGNAGDVMEDTDDAADYAADIFAVRLLAPACLLHEMHIDSAGGIARICGLPPRAAALRAERMELLNRRDAYFTHPLERQVRDAYLPYLREQAAPAQDAAASPEPLAPRRAVSLVLPPSRETPRKERKKAGLLLAVAGFLLLAGALFFLLRR